MTTGARLPTTIAFVAVALAGAARAQVIERHLPPAPGAAAPALPAPAPPTASEDARPLGPALRAIVLLGATDAPVAAPAAAVDAGRLGEAEAARLQRALAGFIGRPLTRKLISDIEAGIVTDYRRREHPFVEVSAPEQELTAGILNLRVVEFRLGKVAVAGVKQTEAERLARAVRAAPGGTIDSGLLAQDLEWLNRNPFETVEVALTPGAALGETDIDLKASRARPWRVYGGYQRSDSDQTGEDRYFVGAAAALPFFNDAFASWQLTASPDFWVDRSLFSQPHPRYLSQAGRFVASAGSRAQIEAAIDDVQTNETVQVFDVRQHTFEAVVDYRFALSNLAPLPGDVAVGVEAKRQKHDTFFAGVDVASGTADVFQLLADWSGAWSDAHGRTSADGALHVSPGGIDRLNSNPNLAVFTNGRVRRSSYLYATFDVSRLTLLPKGFALTDEVVGQYGGVALPPSEQGPIGGAAMARGYLLDDGAFDDTLVGRQELHAPAINGGWGAAPAQISPFLFTDVGWARDEAAGRSAFAASAGGGLSLQLGAHLHGDLTVECPLATLARTRPGQVNLDAKVTVTF